METIQKPTIHKTKQTVTIHNAFCELAILKKQEKNIGKQIKSIQDTIKAQFKLDEAEIGQHIILDKLGDVAGSVTKSEVHSKHSIVANDYDHFVAIMKACGDLIKLENMRPSKTSLRYIFK